MARMNGGMTMAMANGQRYESVGGSGMSFQVDFEPWVGQKPKSDEKLWFTFSKMEMKSPSKSWGIACDWSNRLYVTDRVGNTIICYDHQGQVIFKYPFGGAESRFKRPTGICCDVANNRLIVADKDNHRLSFLSMDGEYIASFGSKGHGNGSFMFPWDVAVPPSGDRIVVADSRNKRIQLFNKYGHYIDKFSIFENSPFEYKDKFDYPRGVTFNGDGSLIYVTDFNNQNILKIPSTMNCYMNVLPAGTLKRPQGLAMDYLDCLMVCDSQNSIVRRLYAPDRQLVPQFRTAGEKRFNFPVNITVMADGHNAALDGEGNVHIF